MSGSLREQLLQVVEAKAESIAWLYDVFAPRLRRRLGHRFGNLPGLDRDDLLQDTFLYLLGRRAQALRQYLDRRPQPSSQDLEHFLWNSACGIVSNRKRSMQRHPSAQVDDEWRFGSQPGDEAPAVARDSVKHLAECLRRGGQQYYLYFQLRYVDGLKPAEIVTTLGWSRKKTYKLKQALDQALERCIEYLGLGR